MEKLISIGSNMFLPKKRISVRPTKSGRRMRYVADDYWLIGVQCDSKKLVQLDVIQDMNLLAVIYTNGPSSYMLPFPIKLQLNIPIRVIAKQHRAKTSVICACNLRPWRKKLDSPGDILEG